MSKFFAAGSDSESESESSEDEIMQQKPTQPARNFQFSDEEEDEKCVVKSKKDKRYDELRGLIKDMKNHKKIKDCAKVCSDFEDQCKAYDKCKKIILEEGKPRFYIRNLVELEDFISEVWEDREQRKKMSKLNAKGLTTLRQKFRKYIRDFEDDMNKYKEAPDKESDASAEEEEQESSESDSDDEGVMKAADFLKKADKKKKSEPKPKDDDESSDDSMDWGSDSDESSSSSDDDRDYSNILQKFLKKTPAEAEKKKEKKDKKKVEKKKKVEEEEEEPQDDAGGDWEVVPGGQFIEKKRPKMFAKNAEINHELILKKLVELVSARGKKGTDRQEQIELIEELRGIADTNSLGIGMDVKILLSLISSVFDYNPNIATCMKSELWEKLISLLNELIAILVNNPNITVWEKIPEESESVTESPFKVRGCVLTMVERMDEEFTKMLQACDAHSTEYVDRLKDEPVVCSIIEKLQAYMEEKSTSEELCRIYLRRIMHTYYKFEEDYMMGRDRSSGVLMKRLCTFIYSKDNTDRLRTQAMLSQIYHLAIHDCWYDARDLMLMSHLQDMIQHSDVPTQILYNRTMVQLGLCAFRQGHIKDAHNALVDIQSTGRAKELLAQGLLLQRQRERTAEEEKIEKRRQMPYHMHINLELLECVYLVSAMLLEIPYMAAHEFDARRRMISKNFHHVMRVSDRQPLVGPPESMREHVVAASKAMKTGDWRNCKNFVINEKMNTKVWELFYQPEKTRDMIVTKIQEESLRTYLFTYSSVYDSLSMVTLAEMFELEKAVVHSIISKMIINEELMASLDEPTQTVVMHRTEPTRFQSLALQLSEKVASLVENNENIMKFKMGQFYQFNKGGQGKDGTYGQRQGQKQWGGQQRNYGDEGGYRGKSKYDYQGGGGYSGGGGGGYQGGGGRGWQQQY